MSEMIDRVARALADAHTGGEMGMRISPNPNEPNVIIEVWRDYIPLARAAIASMREPTEAMVSAARRGAPYDRDAAEIWPEMVDEALK